MNRRNLLKWFGVGATIAPVVSGMPQLQASASLIEVPKVAPVTLERKIPRGLDPYRALVNRRELDVTLIARDPTDGSMFEMRGRSLMLSAKVHTYDVTTHSTTPNGWREMLAGPPLLEWEIVGTLTDNLSRFDNPLKL